MKAGKYLAAVAAILCACPAAAAWAESRAAADSLTAWEIILKGGWTMVPLALLSVAALGLAFHAFLVLDPKYLVPPDLLRELREHLDRGDPAEAENRAARGDSVAARVFAAGLSVRRHGPEKVAEFLANAGRREMGELKRRIAMLGHIGVIAPLFGLLGTVMGMIRAFRVVSLAADPLVQHQKPYLLASAIWEAMVTTAAGLAVGIFALLLYYFFNARLQKAASVLEEETERFALALENVREDRS